MLQQRVDFVAALARFACNAFHIFCHVFVAPLSAAHTHRHTHTHRCVNTRMRYAPRSNRHKMLNANWRLCARRESMPNARCPLSPPPLASHSVCHGLTTFCAWAASIRRRRSVCGASAACHFFCCTPCLLQNVFAAAANKLIVVSYICMCVSPLLSLCHSLFYGPPLEI